MNKDNAKDFLPLVQAMADGKEIEINRYGKWMVENYPSFTEKIEHYRIKPEPRKPREWFVNLYGPQNGQFKVCKKECESAATVAEFARTETIRVREIIEENES